MKKLFVLIIFTANITLMGCYQPSLVVPSCDMAAVGSVCFNNDSSHDIRMKIDNNRFDIIAFGSLCIELDEGFYDYKGKCGLLKRWRGEVFVERCNTTEVRLID